MLIKKFGCGTMDTDQTSQPVVADISEPRQDLDISKTTITVLVLLTLMISVIGTWTVLNEISGVRVVQKSQPAEAHVTLRIGDGSQQSTTSAATGRVTLNVK